MFNNDTPQKKRDVSVSLKNIHVYFDDTAFNQVSLDIPSVLNDDEHRVPKISIKEIAHEDPLNLGNYLKKRISDLEKKSERFQNSSTYHIHLANLYQLSNDDKKSLEHLQLALSLDPDSFTNNKVGDFYIDHQNYDLASKYFDVGISQESTYSCLRKAYISLKNQDVKSTKDLLDQALKIDALDYKTRLFYGAFCLWTGQNEQAIRNFRVASSIKYTSSPLHVNMAAAYWNIGLTSKALKSLQTALAIDPTNENAVYFISDLLYHDQQADKSIKYLEKFIRYEQKSPDAWERLARAYYVSAFNTESKSKHLTNALKALKQKIHFILDASTLNNLGLVSWKLNNHLDASRYFEKSLRMAIQENEPTDHIFYNLIGMMIDTQKYDVAKVTSEKYIGALDTNKNLSIYESRILLQNIVSSFAISSKELAIGNAKRYTENFHIDNISKLEILNYMIYHFAVETQEKKVLQEKIGEALEIINSEDVDNDNLRFRSLNNIIFSYFTLEEDKKAFSLLPFLSSEFHKDPFATATLGLSKLKRNDIEKGKALYLEAISLVVDPSKKAPFRQRMNFEIGKKYLSDNELLKATRYLQKAVSEKNGLPSVKAVAKQLLARLNY